MNYLFNEIFHFIAIILLLPPALIKKPILNHTILFFSKYSVFAFLLAQGKKIPKISYATYIYRFTRLNWWTFFSLRALYFLGSNAFSWSNLLPQWRCNLFVILLTESYFARFQCKYWKRISYVISIVTIVKNFRFRFKTQHWGNSEDSLCLLFSFEDFKRKSRCRGGLIGHTACSISNGFL